MLTKQPCERCGTAVKVHAHRDDYKHPLRVSWLCPADHEQRHKELDEQFTLQPFPSNAMTLVKPMEAPCPPN